MVFYPRSYQLLLLVHLVDLFQLEEINTDIATAFKNGMFVVNKTRRKSSSIGIDHAQEKTISASKEVEVNINTVIVDC